MDDFEREIKAGFLDEATQMLEDVEQSFLVLEQDQSNRSTLEKIFRLAHNLKGSGRAVGFEELAQFTHKFESLLLKLKNGEVAIQTATVGLLLRCKDHIGLMVEGLRANLDAKFDSQELYSELDQHINGQIPSAMPEPALVSAMAPPSADTPSSAPVATPEPEPILAPVHEISLAPVDLAPKAQNKNPPADESLRVSLARVEKLINFVGELVIMESVLKQQAEAAGHVHLRKAVHQLGKVTKEVQDIAMSLRMIPLRQTFQKMQRIVRDTSQVLNKKVNLTIKGEETEIDKTVLEHIGDPLVHLIRNSVDHGIEAEGKRSTSGKDAVGQIQLRAFHQSDSLVIEVEDDGNGLDAEHLRKKAIEKGVIKADAVLTEEECHKLIFAPGFSTKAEVTEVSGRGVGLDVVKTNIERLQGDIHIKTEAGKGTCFRIRLPLC
jgi:two-component system chemotaxis sensor kinase CheA